MRRALRIPEFGVFVALLVMMGVMSFLSPYFFTTLNLFNVLRSMSLIGIMAVGLTMVNITGRIDLSVGSRVGPRREAHHRRVRRRHRRRHRAEVRRHRHHRRRQRLY